MTKEIRLEPKEETIKALGYIICKLPSAEFGMFTEADKSYFRKHLKNAVEILGRTAESGKPFLGMEVLEHKDCPDGRLYLLPSDHPIVKEARAESGKLGTHEDLKTFLEKKEQAHKDSDNMKFEFKSDHDHPIGACNLADHVVDANKKVQPEKGLIEWPEKAALCPHQTVNPKQLCLACESNNDAIDACIAAYQTAQPVKTWTAEDFAKAVFENLSLNLTNQQSHKIGLLIADLVNSHKQPCQKCYPLVCKCKENNETLA